jgi:uncharacterized damage-inducible protein DinB
MSIAQQLLAEFESEISATRRFLERLPSDKLDWKPHPKSMSAGELAFHIAEIPGEILQMAMKDGLPASQAKRSEIHPKNAKEIMDRLDASIAHVRKVLPTLTDDYLQTTWSITMDGKDIVSMPRVAVIRSILLNHWYHHRGQFGVYLRLLGAKVPSSYGPSGDEPPPFMQ